MNRRTIAVLLVACAFLPAHRSLARVFTAESGTGEAPASPQSVLRSAFFLRDSGLQRALPPDSAAGRQLRLRRHFDFILATLVARSDASLEVALSRLQRDRGEVWTIAERDAWRETLARRRLVNIRRLRLYQLRGQFPLNDGAADHAVPIFVDAHDTACAVGHLMRQSGWGDAVAAIQRANNFVYVTDVRDGPLVDWVLVSGLTQEEAALIQPAYDPPPFDATMAELVNGGTLSHNGVLYSNFKFIGGPIIVPDDPPSQNLVDLQSYGVAARNEPWIACCSVLDAVYDDFLFLGAINLNSPIQTDEGQAFGVRYSFDVTAENPGALIAGASIESQPNFNFNYVGNFGADDGRIDVDMRVYSQPLQNPAYLLASYHFDSESDGAPTRLLFGVESESFAPTKTVTVFTSVDLRDATNFASLTHSFDLIPEPAAAALILASLVGLMALLRAVRERGRARRRLCCTSIADMRLIF